MSNEKRRLDKSLIKQYRIFSFFCQGNDFFEFRPFLSKALAMNILFPNFSPVRTLWNFPRQLCVVTYNGLDNRVQYQQLLERNTMNKLILKLLVIGVILVNGGSVFRKDIKKEEPMKLLYVYDALCGWCYGFGPVVEQIEREHKGQVDVDIISGGMIIGSRVQPVGNMADYILKAIPRVEKTTGIEFGEPYKALLREGTYVASSERPSVALCVYKSFKTDDAVSFAHDMQTAFYKDAKDINRDELFADIAATYGIDKAAFLERMQDTTYRTKAYDEFAYASSLGVTGYPCLLVKQGDRYTKLTEGYADYESIDAWLQKTLKTSVK